MMSSPNLSDSIGSLPSLDTLDRPPAIDCPDCKVNDWTIEDGATMVIKLNLCSLHQNGIFATTQPATPQTRQSPRVLSPTPPDATRPTNPHANRTLARGPGAAVSQPLQNTPNRAATSASPLRPSPARSSHRSRSPLRRPLPSSPLSRARAPYSRTALPESCLTLYNKVKTAVQDRRYPRTVKDALAHHKVPERTWRRKQKIAELMILDRSRFDQVVARLIRETGVSRINQTTLTDRCSVEMKKPELIQKRREAILSGDIV